MIISLAAVYLLSLLYDYISVWTQHSSMYPSIFFDGKHDFKSFKFFDMPLTPTKIYIIFPLLWAGLRLFCKWIMTEK